MKKPKRLIIFAAVLSLLAGGYVLFAAPASHQDLPHWRKELGEFAGGTLGWAFAIIYGRTMLKIILRKGPLLQRVLPESSRGEITSYGKKLLSFLNTTHPYLGIISVVLLFSHAYLVGLDQANALLKTIFILALWQFCFGLFLLSRYQIVFLNKAKRYGYMAHSQLYTGIAIGILALFGHLLVD